MNVRLVSVTKSYVTEKELSPEDLIVYTARVSNPSNQLNTDTAERLIKYLIKNKHWSPFEMVDMTVEITTSRGIAQQILRHRSFSFQEFSQRYAEVTEMEPVELRRSGATNRQSSTDLLDPEKELYFTKRTSEAIKHAQEVYKEMLDAGVAKECARMVLPITTQTKIYMKGSIRSWIFYLQIRCGEHTQLEHREVANEILKIFTDIFPNIAPAIGFQNK